MVASPIGTHPDDMELGVSETKDDRSEIIYDEKEAACPYDTTPDDTDVGNDDDKNDKNDKIYDEKEATCPYFQHT